MKKLFYFTMLTFMLIPFAVKAETNLDEIHNSISKDNKITVKSIPLEQYKDTVGYKKCMKKPYSSEEECLKSVYGSFVLSKIKKSIEIPENVNIFSQGCDLEKNTCTIGFAIDYDYQNAIFEDYKINFEQVEVSKKPTEMKSNYRLDDLGYINQIINYKNMHELHNAIKTDLKPLYIYPELKEELEKNKHFDFVIISSGVASGEFMRGAGTTLVMYNDDIAVDVVDLIYTTYTRLYVSDATPKTRDEYAKAAEKRIKEYINDDSYEVKVVFNERYNPEYCEEFDDVCIAKDVFEEGDEYNFEMYTLYLNDESFELEILAVPEKEIKKLKVKSKDYDNDISVETESSDVPLDIIIDTEDVTKNHKGYIKAYDIDLYSGLKDEYITKIKDGIIVRIPLPDEYDKEKVDIYHIKEDGKKGNKYEANIEEIDGKKYAVFTTDHFSIYAIADETEVPNTYDNAIAYIFIGIISLIGLIVSILYLKNNSLES